MMAPRVFKLQSVSRPRVCVVTLDIEHCPIPSVTTQTLGRDDFVGGAASAVVTGFL